MRKIQPNFFRFSFALLACFAGNFLFWFSTTSAQSKPTIRVSAETVIENDRIELGVISQISGEAMQTARLRKISLGYAPNVGMTREITRPQIALAISAAGFAENELTLDAPAKIVVRRAAQEIEESRIREAVEKAVLNQFAADRIEARIVRLDLPAGKILIQSGETEIRVNVANVQNPFAPFSLPVEIRVDNKTVRRLAVNVQIEAFADVLIAARDLTANGKITEADVKIEKRRLEKSITKYVRDAKALRGAVLLKNVSAGTEITTDALAAGYVIKAGDTVQIEAQSGALKIIVKGEARTSGRIGDRVSVKNSQSGAILQAVVVDEGLVRINF